MLSTAWREGSEEENRQFASISGAWRRRLALIWPRKMGIRNDLRLHCVNREDDGYTPSQGCSIREIEEDGC